MTEIDIAAQVARAKALLTPNVIRQWRDAAHEGYCQGWDTGEHRAWVAAVIETLLPLFAEQDAARQILVDHLEFWRVQFASTLGINGKHAPLKESVRVAGEHFVALAHANIALAERTRELDELRNWIARQLANKNAQIDEAYARGRADALAHAAPKATP